MFISETEESDLSDLGKEFDFAAVEGKINNVVYQIQNEDEEKGILLEITFYHVYMYLYTL